jgi:hypothetical protein
MSEIWKPVVGYEGLYEVSSMGAVRSLKHNRGLRLTPRPVKLSTTHDGYKRVILTRDGKGTHKSVHQMMLEAFVGQRPFGLFACHNDDDGLNNVLSNLRWDTPASNYADRDRLCGTAKGERHGCALISEETARKVKIAAQNRAILARDIAKEHGVTISQVRNIRNGNSWAWMEV